VPPPGAPRAVVQIIRAGNRIATTPYKYGGGHGDFDDTGGRERFADDKVPRQSMLVRYEELRGSLDEALLELSPKHKRVIELRMFQGKPFAEIMPELGYTKEVTVRSLYMRAVQRLQELLAQFG